MITSTASDSFSLSEHLVTWIPEISFLLSSMFMIFIGDFIIGKVFVKRMRRMGFFPRTILFVCLGILLLPGLTTLGAFLIRDLVLEPYKDWIIVVLLICFFLIGIFLSIRYNMKIKLKVK